VLLQHGKGADMGAAFGSGASGSLFGATGSSNFLSKSTALAAAIFFAATLGLSMMANQRGVSTGGGVMENVTVPAPVKGSAAIPSAAPVAAPAATEAAPAAAPAATEAAPAASTPASAPASAPAK
ncbi:preprotein translocase subunit SecG, partial [Pseudoduganella sp. RAF53_2]